MRVGAEWGQHMSEVETDTTAVTYLIIQKYLTSPAPASEPEI